MFGHGPPGYTTPPFFPPPGYYRGERGRGISLAPDTPKHPLPILHCPWQSAILPFHLAATLVRPDILSPSPTIWRNREPEISSTRVESRFLIQRRNEILFSKLSTNGEKYWSVYISLFRGFSKGHKILDFIITQDTFRLNSKFTTDALINTHLSFIITYILICLFIRFIIRLDEYYSCI